MSRLKILVLIIASLIIFSSCATKQEGINPEVASKIKKLGIVVTQEKEAFQILDHTGTKDKTYLGGTGGALGALLEGIVLSVEANSAVGQSLGGEPDQLIAMMDGYDVKNLIVSKLKSTLSKTHELVFYSDKSTPPDCDATIEIDFVYGMAALRTEYATPAIKADLKITEQNEKNVILNKIIKSEYYYTHSKKIDEFIPNNAALYKKCISDASQSFSYQVAHELGIIKREEIPTNLPAGIHGWHASCKKPYILTQDCSAITAATREIKINDIKLEIAGTEDGKAFLITPNFSLSDELSSGFSPGPGSKKTKIAKLTLQTVKNFLEEKGFKVLKVTLMYVTDIEGYFLEVDGDAYSELKKLSIQKIK